MKSLVLCLSVAACAVLAGCGSTAHQGMLRAEAKQSLLDSTAAYKQCLAAGGACAREREIYEADLRAAGAIGAGTAVNVQGVR